MRQHHIHPLTASALLFSGMTTGVLAQFVNPPSPDVFTTVDGPLGTQIRFKQVITGPGSICEQHPGVKSYSGFVDVGPHEHVFFWFFEARDVDPSDAPLTAWISGGPGVSSMNELFTEHGPCQVDSDGNVSSNPYSWNARSNTVYIDQPITVGFSYSDPIPGQVSQRNCAIEKLQKDQCPVSSGNVNSCSNYGSGICGTFSKQSPHLTAHSTPSAASTFWLALQGFFAGFPQYTKGGFTLASESYGGHYAPVFARYIHDQNQKRHVNRDTDNSIHIPLKSVLVTNGWFDPAVAYEAHYAFLVDPGNTYDIQLPSEAVGQKMRHALYGDNQCLDRLKVCNSPRGTDEICKHADDYCTSHVQSVYGRQLHRDLYDIRELRPTPFPNGYHIPYLNRPQVLEELAVFTNYSDFSDLVDTTFYQTGDDGKELGITQGLADLLDAGVSITLQHGDADYDCNWYGGEMMWAYIASRSQTSGVKNGYDSAGYQNLTTPDSVWHGQVKQVGSLTFVRVFESGHQVGFFQPVANQAILERTNSGLDIATGLVDVVSTGNGSTYSTQGPKKSLFREGGDTVQHHTLPENAIYNYTTNEPEIPQHHVPNSARWMKVPAWMIGAVVTAVLLV